MRVRGLKRHVIDYQAKHPEVAPHAGAWIETDGKTITKKHIEVAPHAGAWIETPRAVQPLITAPSHPMRVRGLKL